MARESPIRKSDNWFIGEDKVLQFTIDDGGDPPLAVDITTFTLTFTLRSCLNFPPDAPDLTKTSPAGITIHDGPNGIARVLIDDVDTDAFEPGRYFYELKRTNAGFEQVLAFGEAILRSSGIS